MGKKQVLSLRFPIAGLDKGKSYQAQPPFSTPDALNVRPYETLKGRERGGSRPGLGKAFYDLLGAGEPVRMINEVTFLADDNIDFWEDDFSSISIGTIWSQANWLTESPSVLINRTASAFTTTQTGLVRDEISYDNSETYIVEMFIVPYQGEHRGTYSLWFSMNEENPRLVDNGISADLTLEGSTGVFSGTITVYRSGSPTIYTFTGGTTGYATAGWFKVTVTESEDSNTVVCTWLGNTLFSGSVVKPALVVQNLLLETGDVLLTEQGFLFALEDATATIDNNRVGFGIEPTSAGDVALVDTFRLQYERYSS